MKDYQRLQHTLWECKYHVVFIPKYRRKTLFTALLGFVAEIVTETFCRYS